MQNTPTRQSLSHTRFNLLILVFLFFLAVINAQEFDSEIVDINNLHVPLMNDGSLGTDYFGRETEFDGTVIMHQIGFFLSGYIDETLWSNGSFLLVDNYIPGNVNKIPNTKYKFYSVRLSDIPFDTSWQNWKSAVEQGAYFYDGNHNSIYDPVDLNGNGIWDKNEDRPDLIGDFTTWSCVNDGATGEGYFSKTIPLGIEIHQTVFAFSPTTNPDLANIVFLRYIIHNKNVSGKILDDAYFGLAVDPDIGNYNDDKMGSDSVWNFGYSYNNGEDEEYGINPPSLLVDMLQGVQASFPNVTFIDNNGNNTFEEGIDVSLDSAIVNLGGYLGTKKITGSRSIDATSIVYLGRSFGISPPSRKEDAMNYLQGYTRNGEIYDPCTFYAGNYEELNNCSNINPKFVFSGNPVSGEGWLNTWRQDTYFIISSGPFRLEPGKPQTIIAAIIVGRGVDSLNSINVTKEIDEYVQKFYDNNFQEPPVKVETQPNIIPSEFKLFQNYPNPFNPSTTIKYSIKLPTFVKGRSRVRSYVTLKVYDILGREITTLVNEVKQPGNYKVIFNASSLPSGVYYYELRSSDPSAGPKQSFREIKKMLLLR